MKTNLEALAQICDANGIEESELLDHYSNESVVKGLCMNNGCERESEVEALQSNGHCDVCDSHTIKSCLLFKEED